MTFNEIFEKYLKNSSVNFDQARFIWNNAIDEINNKSKYEDFSDLKIPINSGDKLNE